MAAYHSISLSFGLSLPELVITNIIDSFGLKDTLKEFCSLQFNGFFVNFMVQDFSCIQQLTQLRPYLMIL